MIRAADVSPFTPIETENSCINLPALYLYPITSLYGGKEIAEIDASVEALEGSRACIHKNYEMTCLTTALLVATYILSAGILPALAALLTLAIRSSNKFHYVEPTQALNHAGETAPGPQRSAAPSVQAVQGTSDSEESSPETAQFLMELVPAYIADIKSEAHDGLADVRMQAIVTKLNGAQPFEENGKLSEVLDEAIIEEMMAFGTREQLERFALSQDNILRPHLDAAIRRKWLSSTPVSSEKLAQMPSAMRPHRRTYSQLEEIQQEETLYLESRKAQKILQPQAQESSGASALNNDDQEPTSPKIAQNLMELVIDYMADAQHEVQDGLADARMQAIVAKLNGAEPFEGDNWHFSEALAEALVEQFMATSDLQQLQNLRSNWEEMNYAPDQRDVLLPHLDAAIRRIWLASTPVSSEELAKMPSALRSSRRTYAQMEEIQQEEEFYLVSRKAQIAIAHSAQEQTFQEAWGGLMAKSLPELQSLANVSTPAAEPASGAVGLGHLVPAVSMRELGKTGPNWAHDNVEWEPVQFPDRPLPLRPILRDTTLTLPSIEPVTSIHDLGPKPFDTIELRGMGNLHITRGTSNSLTIIADADLSDELAPAKINSKLIIGAFSEESTCAIGYKLTVTSDPRILYHSGSGKVFIDSLETETFSCNILEIGEVVIEGGKLSAQIVKISKSGVYNASNLEAEASEIMIEGSGTAEVRTTTHLKAQSPESGQCIEHGTPSITQILQGIKMEEVPAGATVSFGFNLTWE